MGQARRRPHGMAGANSGPTTQPSTPLGPNPKGRDRSCPISLSLVAFVLTSRDRTEGSSYTRITGSRALTISVADSALSDVGLFLAKSPAHRIFTGYTNRETALGNSPAIYRHTGSCLHNGFEGSPTGSFGGAGGNENDVARLQIHVRRFCGQNLLK
jgi:hypothetical protein